MKRDSAIEDFDTSLKRLYFDTVLYNKESLELLFSLVGSDRCMFGTENPGSGTATDPDGNTSEFGPRIQHDSDGSGLPPVSSSGLLVQPRDAIDWTLFNDPIDGGTFEVDGQTAFPGVDIGVDGWIAFGDPSQRTPPGVDEVPRRR